VPGALSINLTTREASGIQEDPRNLTGGVAGVHRLCKALLSAGYIEASLEEWGEDIVSANFILPLIVFQYLFLSSFSYSSGQTLVLIPCYANGQRQILFYPTRQRAHQTRALKR
jgi:hypothetical protein